MSTGGPVPGVGYDGKNSIIFQTTDWTDMSPELIAFTEHSSRPDGEIVDTDMEINATPGLRSHLGQPRYRLAST
jgi:hypothetical protein